MRQSSKLVFSLPMSKVLIKGIPNETIIKNKQVYVGTLYFQMIFKENNDIFVNSIRFGEVRFLQ